jgi:hypothetical protein
MSAPTLLELQCAVQRSLTAHDDADAAGYLVADGIDAAARLGIYRNTFATVLVNALRLSYPAVRRLVGDECFEGAARRFIDEVPPRSANLDGYGAGFADFLTRFEPVAALGYMPDVARLEWLVNRAIHAPDVASLDLGRLAALKQDQQARVCFTPHPSTGLLRVEHAADAIWRAVLAHDDAALAAIDPGSGPVWLLVHRTEGGVEVTRLSEAAWCFTEALFAGRPLHSALDETACSDAPKLLAEHLAAGCFVDFELPTAVSRYGAR